MIDQLIERILAIRTDHPVRVGFDGPAAAGKTTLADEVAARMTHRTVIRSEPDHFMRMVEDTTAQRDRLLSGRFGGGACPPAAIRRVVTRPASTRRVGFPPSGNACSPLRVTRPR